MTIYTDEVASAVIDRVVKNWKSSATGALTAISSCIVAYQVLPSTASKSVIALAIISALISFLKKDAGKQP